MAQPHRHSHPRTHWLPSGWRIRFKQRTEGATAGRVDKFYIDPTGRRQFRSKIEVLSFLQTGRRRTRKPNRDLTTLKWGKKKRRTGPIAQTPPQEGRT